MWNSASGGPPRGSGAWRRNCAFASPPSRQATKTSKSDFVRIRPVLCHHRQSTARDGSALEKRLELAADLVRRVELDRGQADSPGALDIAREVVDEHGLGKVERESVA